MYISVHVNQCNPHSIADSNKRSAKLYQHNSDTMAETRKQTDRQSRPEHRYQTYNPNEEEGIRQTDTDEQTNKLPKILYIISIIIIN